MTRLEAQIPMWEAMYGYLIAEADNLNLAAVLGLGDMVQDAWTETATGAVLDGFNALRTAGIPILPIVGNHDYDDLDSRDATTYLSIMGPDYYSGDVNWLGGYGGSTMSHAIGFSAGGTDYIVIGLEFYPRDEHLAWAGNLILSNPSKTIILTTHSYMNYLCIRTTTGYQAIEEYNTGAEVWAWAKQFENVKYIFCGHVCYWGYRTDAGDNLNTIYQINTDYQKYNYGDGLITFVVVRSTGAVDMVSWSPYATEYHENSLTHFS